MPQKKIFYSLLLFILSIGIILGTHFDAFLYQDTVAKVVSVKTLNRQKNIDEHENVDHTTTQKLTLEILNTRQKGQHVQVHNSYTESQAVDQKYHVGQQVLISLSHNQNVVIKGLKRDTFIVALICLTISLILLIVHKKGLMAIISLMVNSLLFILAIQLELIHNGKNILPIFSGLVFIFTLVTLALIFGLNRQLLVAATATIISTFISFGLFLLILNSTHEQGIHYEAMSYAVQQPKIIFLAQILIGALGAIMDEATDITSTLQQLRLENPAFKFKQIFPVGMGMGRQIIGPLISILFLIFMADTIPMAVLYLRNGNSILQTFNWTMYLGLVQSLVSAIGIVLTVPLTSVLAGQLLGGNQNGRR
ncbi:YibE/F family protein [Agrilactobacillus yilanensis]|uniref:YibE/F family protein n=1 Tax=Agrilactobacillus yilanensis TaxID=2485997 RepID=A0ABW4J890_9LACO|nr:YibE/F family protein [Agrilactobacillus yilanensis]